MFGNGLIRWLLSNLREPTDRVFPGPGVESSHPSRPCWRRFARGQRVSGDVGIGDHRAAVRGEEVALVLAQREVRERVRPVGADQAPGPLALVLPGPEGAVSGRKTGTAMTRRPTTPARSATPGDRL